MISTYDYYTNVDTPTVEEFLDKKADVRRAFLACMATLHTVDYVVQNQEPDPGATDTLVKEFTRDSFQESSDFEVVAAFALASNIVDYREAIGPTFILERMSLRWGPFGTKGRKSMEAFSMR